MSILKEVIRTFAEVAVENINRKLTQDLNKNFNVDSKINEQEKKISTIENEIIFIKDEVAKIKLIFYGLSVITFINLFIGIYLILK
jgi:hypothetical protein